MGALRGQLIERSATQIIDPHVGLASFVNIENHTLAVRRKPGILESAGKQLEGFFCSLPIHPRECSFRPPTA
jgi:hypothetical protein